MRQFGHFLLWIGFLSAAFWSVCRLEDADEKWSTIPWGWYAGSVVVGIVGIALLRLADRQIHGDHAQTEAEFSVIQESLAELAATVGRLASIRQHVPSEVLRCIDDDCAPKFAEFAEARQSLIKRFGLQVYADVMTEFASAERYVNRSWSAAADGYVDEVAASLDKANRYLQNAQRLLLAAERGA
jgi:hypothetical protein